jgi:hypothetical protein
MAATETAITMSAGWSLIIFCGGGEGRGMGLMMLRKLMKSSTLSLCMRAFCGLQHPPTVVLWVGRGVMNGQWML